MVSNIVESIVVTDDIHLYWASVEVFQEFQQKSIQHAIRGTGMYLIHMPSLLCRITNRVYFIHSNFYILILSEENIHSIVF